MSRPGCKDTRRHVNVDTSLLPKLISLAKDGIGEGLRTSNALIQGKWKLILGDSGVYDGWSTNDPYTVVPAEAKDGFQRVHGHNVYLFDLQADEEERDNLAKTNPDIARKMIDRLHELQHPKHGYVPTQYNMPHARSLPSFHNGSWAPFLGDEEFLDLDDEAMV